jgi:hypothetical protein
MEEIKKENKKMSYEELEQIASQLSVQNQQLYARLNQAELSNMFRRLDLLFKVVENAPAFSETFVNKCISEIEDIMTIPEEDVNVEEDNK